MKPQAERVLQGLHQVKGVQAMTSRARPGHAVLEALEDWRRVKRGLGCQQQRFLPLTPSLLLFWSVVTQHQLARDGHAWIELAKWRHVSALTHTRTHT